VIQHLLEKKEGKIWLRDYSSLISVDVDYVVSVINEQQNTNDTQNICNTFRVGNDEVGCSFRMTACAYKDMLLNYFNRQTKWSDYKNSVMKNIARALAIPRSIRSVDTHIRKVMMMCKWAIYCHYWEKKMNYNAAMYINIFASLIEYFRMYDLQNGSNLYSEATKPFMRDEVIAFGIHKKITPSFNIEY
jgi:hypothetical protein